jgi:adhesin transport system membrane fusion protein
MANYLNQLQQAYRARQVIWLISGLVILIIIWASLAELDEVVVGQGQLIPPASVQKVQSLDGGILRQVHVVEGESVQPGQLLVSLDETRAQASFSEVAAEEESLQARRLRLLAELNSTDAKNIVITPFKGEYSAENTALNNEAESYLAELADLTSKVGKADEDIIQQRRELAEAKNNIQTMIDSLALLDEEILLTKNAVDSGALSASELRKMERERVNVAGRLSAEGIKLGKLRSMVTESERMRNQVFSSFRSQLRKELSETDARLARVKQILAGLNNQLEQTRMSAGMAGQIKSISLSTIGGVIRPGETIMEIVPQNETLLVEAKVSPKDIGRLTLGQSAIVKFSAYDFVIHGGIKGVLKHISPDATSDEKGNTFFIVHITAEAGVWQQGLWLDKPMIPGMQAQVDIISGKKTILQYWFKPLLRAKANSMREP